MQRVVHLVDAQHLLAAHNDQGFLNGQAQHFVRRQNRAAADAAGLPVFRRVIGQAESAEYLGAAGHRHTGDAGARRDILGGQRVGAAQEELDVACLLYTSRCV